MLPKAPHRTCRGLALCMPHGHVFCLLPRNIHNIPRGLCTSWAHLPHTHAPWAHYMPRGHLYHVPRGHFHHMPRGRFHHAPHGHFHHVPPWALLPRALWAPPPRALYALTTYAPWAPTPYAPWAYPPNGSLGGSTMGVSILPSGILHHIYHYYISTVNIPCHCYMIPFHSHE